MSRRLHTDVPTLRDAFRTLLARPDEVMLEVGAGGELLVARMRAVIALLLLLLPLCNAITGGSVRETMLGLGVALGLSLCAQVLLMLARRTRVYRWLPFATAAFDVTATSAVLVLLVSFNPPSGLNNIFIWCGYVLAIVLTALRSDGRTTLLAGALAVCEYGLIAGAMLMLADSPEQLVSADYGAITWSGQIQRMAMLAIVTVVVAVVVYRLKHLIEMSGTDGLTRLPNRAWLLHRVPRLINAAREDRGSLSIALINLDRFKRINDDAGHLVGDRALRHVVDVLKQTSEPGEWLVRLGGEEFVLVLRQPIGTAWERVDTIRRVLSERPFESERSAEPIRMTFSAGIAGYPNEGGDLSHLLRRADHRLQAAKREGRNRVVARDG